MKEIIVKSFDVFDRTDGRAIIENLKTFEEAEDFVIAHDKKEHADWSLAFYQDSERAKEFKHHEYLLYHSEGKIVTYDDSLEDMPFADLCDEVERWRAISVVEFKF